MHVGVELMLYGGVLLITVVVARFAAKLGLPSIPVYMLVGLLVSKNFPWVPLSVGGSHTLELLAVFGLVLLLFSLGLEFDQDEFYGNAGRLLIAGGSYVVLNMGIGLAFGFWLGWGGKEAIVIAGMTATSSSAIVTKLLIELRRLDNDETPMILGVTVIEDVFIAVYLAVVTVVLSDVSNFGAAALKLGVSFVFLAVMFTLARFGGKWLDRIFRTPDTELFTVLCFGAVLFFGGLGEELGVTDAIGAFLIGLLLGATKQRAKFERVALPLRDVFCAFFFLNFGLGLDVRTFGSVLWPVVVAVVMTVVINVVAGQFVSWLQRLGVKAGINAAAILMNRGEFALILAAIAAASGLDDRVVAFAGLYVLIMSVFAPIVARFSDRIGESIVRDRPRAVSKLVQTDQG